VQGRREGSGRRPDRYIITSFMIDSPQPLSRLVFHTGCDPLQGTRWHAQTRAPSVLLLMYHSVLPLGGRANVNLGNRHHRSGCGWRDHVLYAARLMHLKCPERSPRSSASTFVRSAYRFREANRPARPSLQACVRTASGIGVRGAGPPW
jgi:hypothetical protein